ncbi:MAG: spondin domain-containing protein [Gammaproteobacteria bacterium]|nr:spondin domain-containing protein [Gammaproteobacteria bacterium]
MKNLIAFLSLSLLLAANANASGLKQYQVSITNATAHHVFTPTLIATHGSAFNLFKVGQAASEGLVVQAETGDPSLLLAETQSQAEVFDTLIGTFIAYGQTASFMITAPRKARLSLTAMLATTNDGFVALDNVALPRHSATYYAYAYDAGSEDNNEDCAYIPGPPCAADSGNARDTNSEGFVSLHNGIHGQASLEPKDLDWHGPVAIITITRVHH